MSLFRRRPWFPRQRPKTAALFATASLDATVAGAQSSQAGSAAASLRLNATDSGVQSPQTGASAGSERLNASSASPQASQSGSGTGALGLDAPEAGAQWQQTGAATGIPTLVASVSGAQGIQAGSSAGEAVGAEPEPESPSVIVYGRKVWPWPQERPRVIEATVSGGQNRQTGGALVDLAYSAEVGGSQKPQGGKAYAEVIDWESILRDEAEMLAAAA